LLVLSSRKKPWKSRRLFGLKKSEAKMKNLDSLMAAYLAVWAIFFVYHFTVARRVARLQDEIARLKQNLKQ
jgi:CcmD family protein